MACQDEQADFSTTKTHHSAAAFTITAVKAVAAAPQAAVISVVFTDVTATPRAAIIQVVFTAITVVLAIGVVVGAVADYPIPSSCGLGIFREAYSD